VRINIYIIKQLSLAFLIVVLSLTCVVWLSQSLRFIDMIVNRGLPLATFIYLTILLLPTWLSIVMPIAGFASVLFIYNRMLIDREIIILIASGLSPLRLARPAIFISSVIMGLCYFMTLYMIPVSYRAFKELQFQIRHNYTDILLREGVFNRIGKDITVFVRKRNSKGELVGIIVNDDRNSQQKITLIAQTGALILTDKGPRVFMQNGNRQAHNVKTGQTGLLYFDSYTVNLGGIKSIAQRSWRDKNELSLQELLSPTKETTGTKKFNRYIAEGHYRLSSPILALALPLIGLAILLRGEFSRRGQTWRLIMAVLAAAVVECFGLGSKFLASKELFLMPIMYATVIAPILLAFFLLTSRHLRTAQTNNTNS
jgi:lipopolysaccharide export system permease protein